MFLAFSELIATATESSTVPPDAGSWRSVVVNSASPPDTGATARSESVAAPGIACQIGPKYGNGLIRAEQADFVE